MSGKKPKLKTLVFDKDKPLHVGVLGGGAWGTALAQSMRHAGHSVTLWAYEFETVAEINAHHTNRVYLPGVTIDSKIRATAKAEELGAADILLLVAPSQFVRMVAQEIAGHFAGGKPVVVCTKGFEEQTGSLMTDVVASVIPDAALAVLSGPSFAGEVARGLPVALTLACKNENLGQEIGAALSHKGFRLYWTSDVTGAQAGGGVKNVLAIAAGIVDGRQLGASAHAALTTRGFAELARFGTALGGRFETMTGLSGLGDLILTCSSAQSRNMSLGQALGQGKSLDDILGARRSITEGIHSVGAVVALAERHGIDMPVCQAVNRVLAGEISVDDAIEAILARPLRQETDAPAARKKTA